MDKLTIKLVRYTLLVH